MEKGATAFLEGYRVLDLTDEKGHFCGKLLGDLGADVIKIEPPGGDPGRNRGPFYKDIPHPEKSLQWFFTALNKRSITLNLASTDGVALFEKLVSTADFVVESYEPGYMNSLGLGYEALERIKPSIVVTSITPFGQTGPYAHYKASDLVGVSMGGMARLFGELDGPPVRISAPQFYCLGSLHAAMGSMVAHYHRELTGQGQHVDVSCQQAVVLANRIAAETWDLLRVNSRGAGPNAVAPRPTPPGPLYVQIVRECKDGHVTVFFGGAQAGMVKSSRELVALANREGIALDLKDFEWEKMDASTATQEEITKRNEMLNPYFAGKTKGELFGEAIEREILLIPVNTAADLAASPQLESREYWKKVEHPELVDEINYPGWPVKWTELPPYRPQRRAPLIGEHNREVYEEELGLSRDQLEMLKSGGVI